MDRRGRSFYPDTEESNRRCNKKKECHEDLYPQYTRKEWNEENCQITPESRPRLTIFRQDFEEDMEKERLGRRYDIENLSKQESSGKIRHKFLYGFHNRNGEMRKTTREKVSVPNYDGWMRDQGSAPKYDGWMRDQGSVPSYDGWMREKVSVPNYDGWMRDQGSAPNYDGWMRDQGWVRNFDGFWERRDGRYWEKMQYYEKYREWEMELTEAREGSKDLERGCECKAKSREKDWNRFERGYDSNEMKLPRKSSIDTIFSENVSSVSYSRPSKKRSFSDIIKCDDGTSQKHRTKANGSDSMKKLSISSQSSSSSEIGKVSKLKRISPGENSNTEKKIAHSDPNVMRKVSKDSGSSGTPGIENMLSTRNTFEVENLPKLSTDECSHSQGTKTCGNGSTPRSRSLSWRFTSLCQSSEISFAEVNMINMEVTIVNDSDQDILERKETPINKDTLEQKRMKCLKNKGVFIPTDDVEESLPTDEGKETTESSVENDDSSKESDNDAEESNDAMESSKRSEEVFNSNSLHEDRNEDPCNKELDQPNCKDKRNDNLYVTNQDLSVNSKEKMDTDMIDLNVSQDLFKTAPSDNITEDQQMSKAESDIAVQDEEISNEIYDVKKLEQTVAIIEQRIADLRAKL